MLETNDLLVKCPRCGAWPMAVSSGKDTFAQREIAFRCPKCGSEETGRTPARRPLAGLSTWRSGCGLSHLAARFPGTWLLIAT